jgi:cyclopropane fatty-acyl-phospholipid synthase-like methyltransferase
LIPDKPDYVGNLVLHITNYWHTWGNLDSLIREGRTELPFQNGFTDAETYWKDYMEGQHNRATAGQGQNLAQSLDLSGRRKLLDLGGGAASYSIALCAANPQLCSSVIDAKEPLAIAQPLVKAANLQDRITLVEGDMNTIDLDDDNDVVMISGVVLIKSEKECRHIFHRAYQALAPGGLIIVQDFMRVDHSDKRRFLDTMMDMYVLVGFNPGAGDRYGDEYATWLA